MHASEVADPRMVRVVIGRQHSEGHVLVRPPFYLARRRYTDAVRVQQQRHHHLRMVWRIAAQLAFVVRVDRRQIELRDDIHDEARQVVFRQPLERRWWQQEALTGRVRPVDLAHASNKQYPPAIVDPGAHALWLGGGGGWWGAPAGPPLRRCRLPPADGRSGGPEGAPRRLLLRRSPSRARAQRGNPAITTTDSQTRACLGLASGRPARGAVTRGRPGRPQCSNRSFSLTGHSFSGRARSSLGRSP
jgi:hypothetical protein